MDFKKYFLAASVVFIGGLIVLYTGLNRPGVSKPPVLQQNNAMHQGSHAK